MTQIQEAFLNELKSNPRFTIAEYAALYNKHKKLAIEDEENNGANTRQANTMGNYYTIAVLSNFLDNENVLSRIIKLSES